MRDNGQFFTAELAGEPLVVARGDDGQLRAFYNVCRHHAAAVVTEPQGCAKQFRCPYHGWTYGIDGALKGMVEFDGVCNFDRAKNGLVPVRVDTWENFVFVNLDGRAAPLREFFGRSARGWSHRSSSPKSFTSSIAASTRSIVTGKSTSITISTAATTSRTLIKD